MTPNSESWIKFQSPRIQKGLRIYLGLSVKCFFLNINHSHRHSSLQKAVWSKYISFQVILTGSSVEVGINPSQIMVSKLSSCNGIFEKARIWKLGACRVCLMAWSCPTALNPVSPDPTCDVLGVHRYDCGIFQGYFFQCL